MAEFQQAAFQNAERIPVVEWARCGVVHHPQVSATVSAGAGGRCISVSTAGEALAGNAEMVKETVAE